MALQSVVDLLAEQPEEALQAMRDAVQKELARLTVEVQQIDQALSKKSRRNRSAAGGRLTREQVWEVVRSAALPLTPSEVHTLLAQEGSTASLNSVRNHLARLVDKNGMLARYPDGKFGLHFDGTEPADEPVFVHSDPNDDIPF